MMQMIRKSWLRGRAGREAERGVTLVEMMVGLIVAALIFFGAAAALMAALAGTRLSRQTQKATELTSATIETARKQQFASVATKATSTELAVLASPAQNVLSTVAGTYYFKPDQAAIGSGEKVFADTTAAMPAPVASVTQDGTTYRVITVVTTPEVNSTTTACAINAACYKRVTVRAYWQHNGATRTVQEDSLIAETQRGLPLPKFTWKFTDALTAMSGEGGTTFVIPLSLTNKGARDAWDITSNAPVAWNPKVWVDTNGNGSLDASPTDALLTDSGANGVVDTATVETDTTRLMWLVLTPPVAFIGTSTTSVVVTAASVAQAAIGTKTLTRAVTVTPLACNLCTWTSYYLHNKTSGPAGANTTLQAEMAANATAPAWAGAIPDYDGANAPGSPGRALTVGATNWTESTATDRIATWKYFVTGPGPFTLKLKGGRQIWIRVWVAGAGFVSGSKDQKFRAYALYETAAPTPTLIGSGDSLTKSYGSGSAFEELWIPINVGLSDVTIAKNRNLIIKVISPVDPILPPGQQSAAWLAYDTTAYPAIVLVPKA